jgi:hypothetical protein
LHPHPRNAKQDRFLSLLLASIVVISFAVFAKAEAPITSPSAIAAHVDASGNVQLPTGYRRWQHVGTRVKTGGNSVLDGTKIVVPQVMDAFVEPTAFDTYKRTGLWPDGTQIVKEFATIQTGKGCDDTTHICNTPYGLGIFETGRYQGLGMMIKDRKRFPAESGYWGYFRFLPSGQSYTQVSAPLPRDQCSGCHEVNARATDFVFSTTHIGLLPDNLK